MIVHGVLSLAVGGLERIVVALARHRHGKGLPVAVLCLETTGQLAEELSGRGIMVKCLDKPPGRDKCITPKVNALLRELGATVLHSHQLGATVHLAPAAKQLGIRVIHTEHGNPFARAASGLECLKLRLLFWSMRAKVDHFAAVSSEIADSLARYRTVPRSKIHIVPNGLAPVEPATSRDVMRVSLGIPADAYVIGTVGRLHEVKRQDILLKAVAGVDGAWLLLVGDGPERVALEKLARELNIAARVIFAGYQSEPAAYLAAMDVFALTSRSEGFPVSLLEAWNAKLPVVVSAVGGLPGIVSNGKNGLLIPFGDLSAMSAAFAELRGGSTLGEAGHAEFLHRYTLERMATAYESLYADRRCIPGAECA